MTKHPAYDDDFPVIVEEFKAGKIPLARATRELLYIGVGEDEVAGALGVEVPADVIAAAAELNAELTRWRREAAADG